MSLRLNMASFLPRGMGFYPVLLAEPFWKLPQNWACRLIFDLCHTPYFLDADDVFISSFAGGHIPIVKVDETVFV